MTLRTKYTPFKNFYSGDIVKSLIVAATLLVSFSSFANTPMECTAKCTEKGFPGIGSAVATASSTIWHLGNRQYETWVKSCKVLTPEGEVFYSNKISGPELTAIWASEQRGDGRYEGEFFEEKRSEKEDKQQLKVSNKILECNELALESSSAN
jgi:hypothetical protein